MVDVLIMDLSSECGGLHATLRRSKACPPTDEGGGTAGRGRRVRECGGRARQSAKLQDQVRFLNGLFELVKATNQIGEADYRPALG